MPSTLLSQQRNMVRNLAALYRVRSADDDTRGRVWYARAHALMILFADRYNVPIATAAYVTAALSPQCAWTRNLIATRDVLADLPVHYGPLPVNTAKAKRIYQDRATSVDDYFTIRACKVRSFARNLAGDTSHVTVDTHAVQAAFNDVSLVWYSTIGKYAVVADAYRIAAGRLDLDPSTLQAIVWHTWKRQNPPAYKRVIRRQW